MSKAAETILREDRKSLSSEEIAQVLKELECSGKDLMLD
jgi:hypothetical protein